MRTLVISLMCLLVSGINYHVQNRLRKFLYTSVDTIPQNAQKLINSYSGYIAGYANNHIILKDGTKLLWDDGIKNKTAKLLLDKPDIEDMFSQKYSVGIQKISPAVNFDPGRVRNEAFFMKMYGAREREVGRETAPAFR